MSSQTNIIGDYLKQQRESAGLLQREVAKHAGVSNSTICRIESGALLPTVDVLVKIGDRLDLDLTGLLAKLGHRTRRDLPEFEAYLRERYALTEDMIATLGAQFKQITQVAEDN